MAVDEEKEPNFLIGPIDGVCEACHQFKPTCLYGLQDGSTAWVCRECRDGD
jgi:hypothetical protein